MEVTPGSGRAEDVFLHVIQVGNQVLDAMDPVELVQSDGVCGVRLSRPNETRTATFRTEGDLGGQLICADGKNAEYDLANTVQPQSGIMGKEK